MCMDTCRKCGEQIDTDDEPESYVGEVCYCEDCRADMDSMDLEDQLDELLLTKIEAALSKAALQTGEM
jgi:hypothetical protein